MSPQELLIYLTEEKDFAYDDIKELESKEWVLNGVPGVIVLTIKPLRAYNLLGVL